MDRLFDEVRLPRVVLKNRIVRSATASGAPSPAVYRALAEGGAGLIITGHCFVSPEGRASPGQCSLCADGDVPALAAIVEAVKPSGARIVAQISHGGAHSVPPDGYSRRISPSENEGAEAMTETDIAALKASFIAAAKRTKAAGFDGVQLHCAHMYGLSQFLSRRFNRRTDRWGGPVENRWRICREIIEGVRRECGDEYPIFIKINGNDPVGDELYREEMLWILRDCEALGVEAAEISGDPPVPPERRGRPYFIDRAAYFASKVDMPLMLVGGLRCPEHFREALDAGITLLSFSRPFMRMPDFPNRLRSERELSLYQEK